MANFPRVGIELTTECELRFPEAEHERPALVIRMSNGFREGRFLTGGSTYNFVVSFKGNETDFNTMMAFIQLHGSVTPFTLAHPDYGTGTAYLAAAKHKISKIVAGKPGLRWFALQIAIEAEF